MKYLNIIDEIFSSDIGFFMFGGLIVAMVISICLKMTKKIIAGGFISLLIYVLCEIGLNISADYMLGFMMLFVGTCALGCVIGFIIGLIISVALSKRRS